MLVPGLIQVQKTLVRLVFGFGGSALTVQFGRQVLRVRGGLMSYHGLGCHIQIRRVTSVCIRFKMLAVLNNRKP